MDRIQKAKLKLAAGRRPAKGSFGTRDANAKSTKPFSRVEFAPGAPIVPLKDGHEHQDWQRLMFWKEVDKAEGEKSSGAKWAAHRYGLLQEHNAHVAGRMAQDPMKVLTALHWRRHAHQRHAQNPDLQAAYANGFRNTLLGEENPRSSPTQRQPQPQASPSAMSPSSEHQRGTQRVSPQQQQQQPPPSSPISALPRRLTPMASPVASRPSTCPGLRSAAVGSRGPLSCPLSASRAPVLRPASSSYSQRGSRLLARRPTR